MTINIQKISLTAILIGICSVLFIHETYAQNTTVEVGVVTEVDEQPKPDGGMEALINHFTKNLKYPETAKEQKIEGIVVATFLVQKDGSITDAEILRGIGGGCDEEAIRMINIMDNWIPGKVNGEPVITRMRLPVKFQL